MFCNLLSWVHSTLEMSVKCIPSTPSLLSCLPGGPHDCHSSWYSGHHLSFFLLVNFHLIAWVDLLEDRSTHHLQNEVNSLTSQMVLESWPCVRPCSGHWGHSNAQEQSPVLTELTLWLERQARNKKSWAWPIRPVTVQPCPLSPAPSCTASRVMVPKCPTLLVFAHADPFLHLLTPILPLEVQVSPLLGSLPWLSQKVGHSFCISVSVMPTFLWLYLEGYDDLFTWLSPPWRASCRQVLCLIYLLSLSA